MSSTLVRAAVLTAFAALPVLGQDPKQKEPEHPTCDQTAERVLEPFRKRVEAALMAEAEYVRIATEAIATTKERIATLRATAGTFAEAKAKEIETATFRVAEARKAIAEGRAAAEKRIAELRAQAADLRQKGSIKRADRALAAADKLAGELARREVTWYSKPLRFSKSLTGWEKYIVDILAAHRERLALWAAGKVTVYHTPFRSNADRQKIEQWTREAQDKIRSIVRREPRYYLKPLRANFTGEGIHAHVKQRQDELAEALRQIALGTFKLYVHTLRSTTTRNNVQGLINAAKDEIARRQQAWAKKEYKHYNDKIRATTTNGAIEKSIADLEKELAEYVRKGKEAVAYAGGSVTGRQLEQAIAEARRAGKTEWAGKLSQRLAKWQKAKNEKIADYREKIAWWQEVLKRHRELFEEDQANRQKDIDTRLTWALGETPCGGGGASTDVVDLQEFLQRNSETEQEADCRKERFGDHVFVRRDGSVIGNPRMGLAAGMSDLPLGEAARTLDGHQIIARQDSNADKALNRFDEAAAAIQDWKDKAELSAHAYGLGKILAAQERLNGFYARLRAMPQRAKDLAEMGPVLAKDYADLPDLLDEAYQSRAAIEQAIKDLGRRALGPEARKLRDQLMAVRNSLDELKKLSWAGRLRESFNAMRSLNLPANAGFRQSLNGGIQRILGATAADVKASPLAQMMLVASVLKGVADTQTRISGGMRWDEAFVRSSADFAVDLVIAGIPLTAAAEMIATLGLNVASYMTDDDSYKQATPSELAKFVTQETLNGVAWLSRKAGEVGAEDIQKILERNIDPAAIRRSLAEVEQKLQSVTPGSPEAERLMRMRRAFRMYLRARDGSPCS